jgi:hypothetical protein
MTVLGGRPGIAPRTDVTRRAWSSFYDETEGADVVIRNDSPSSWERATATLVQCPTCGLPAEITERFVLGGVPEPVEHVKIVCVRRHWYALPVDMFPVSAPISEHTGLRG